MRRPTSTYRLQFEARFGFEEARAIVEYLADLGVGDVYASPLLAACPGSTHGYDVADPTRLNEELGTYDAFVAFSDALRDRGLGLLLDVVPNHMGMSAEANPWWRDVLARGKRSRFSEHFDVYWDEDRVRIPVLGKPLAEVLAAGELVLDRNGEGTMLRYHDRTYPLTEESQRLVHDRLEEAASGLETESGRDLGAALAALSTEEFLNQLLSAQHYVLDDFRSAAENPGYRRFFEINDLIGVRVEDRMVFDDRHRTLFDLVQEGRITGLRIDHIDGLRRPGEYLRRLQEEATSLRDGDAAAQGPFFVVVEKILAPDESLPDWPAAGTTGYEFLNTLLRLFVAPAGVREVFDTYHRFTKTTDEYGTVAYSCKRLILSRSFSGEVDRLAKRAAGLAQSAHLDAKRFSGALHAVIARLPVYRTYREPMSRGPTEADRRTLEATFRSVRKGNPDVSPEALDWLENALSGPLGMDGQGPEAEAALVDFVLRFQQLSGPIAAKGVEDTAFYRYVPLVALNEVGGEPDWQTVSDERFHAENKRRLDGGGGGLSATATHDTKRGEDARIRIALLSEVPDAWKGALGRWHSMNERFRRSVGGRPAPAPHEEYLFYQSVLGAIECDDGDPTWASFQERIQAFMLKALREAKVNTDWVGSNGEYEEAVAEFVRGALSNREFVADVLELVELLRVPAALSSLGQVALKVASPGIPDFYQGTEIWDHSLVDPDNRRPVSYAILAERLAAIKRRFERDPIGTWSAALSDPSSGDAKLLLSHRVLSVRKRKRDVFEDGSYVPLRAEGPFARHVVAFARVLSDDAVIVVAGRFLVSLGEGSIWDGLKLTSNEALPVGRYSDAITTRSFSLTRSATGIIPGAHALDRLPVALFERVDDQSEVPSGR